jgi:hypothetical protein
MPNGKPGDHPLTDILAHKHEVYGQEGDDLIRKIADLCSRRELDEWWQREIGWSYDHNCVVSKARIRLDELLQRAKQRETLVRVRWRVGCRSVLAVSLFGI